ncbi:MAG: hypothetical protein AABM40_04365 [Chloroflexota bacterium]
MTEEVARRAAPAPGELAEPPSIATAFPVIVRDPLYGDIRLHPHEVALIDSDIFQRQRGVKQLGTALLVYPSAVQTRFVHALGNLQLISDMAERALEDLDNPVVREFLEQARRWLSRPAAEELRDVRRAVIQIARLAGLCHDLGHFPLGHVLEIPLSRPGIRDKVLGVEEDARLTEFTAEHKIQLHEWATMKLIETNGAPGKPMFQADDDWLRRAMLEVIRATHGRQADTNPVPAALAELVSGEVDSDRAEYLRRDGYVSGSGFGQYDVHRVIASFVVAKDRQDFLFRPSTRALAAIEIFLTERVRAYTYLYFHPVGVLMDTLLDEILYILFGQRDELLEPLKGKARAQLEQALESLAPSDLSYTAFVGPKGYVDDATLWVFLRRVHATLRDDSLEEGALPARPHRRLRAFLDVLLLRRHRWVSLWKRPDEFRDVSRDAFAAMVRVVEEKRGLPFEATTLQDRIRDWLSSTTGYAYTDARLISVLNFLAYAYAPSLTVIAAALESKLGEGLHVVIGHKAMFQPLKEPQRYRILDEQGRLRSLEELDRPGVSAIQAAWYEGIQLRVYVVSETDLSDEQRENLRADACAALPEAMRTWYLEDDIVSWHPDTGFLGIAQK